VYVAVFYALDVFRVDAQRISPVSVSTRWLTAKSVERRSWFEQRILGYSLRFNSPLVQKIVTTDLGFVVVSVHAHHLACAGCASDDSSGHGVDFKMHILLETDNDAEL
jgi:hypothetical protein